MQAPDQSLLFAAYQEIGEESSGNIIRTRSR